MRSSSWLRTSRSAVFPLLSQKNVWNETAFSLHWCKKYLKIFSKDNFKGLVMTYSKTVPKIYNTPLNGKRPDSSLALTVASLDNLKFDNFCIKETGNYKNGNITNEISTIERNRGKPNFLLRNKYIISQERTYFRSRHQQSAKCQKVLTKTRQKYKFCFTVCACVVLNNFK